MSFSIGALVPTCCQEKHSTKSEMLAGKLQTVAGEISETKGELLVLDG